MVTKIIGTPAVKKETKKKTRASDSAMKPLAKMFLDQNPELQDKEYPIFSGGLTPKGFLLLRCKDFSVLMPGGHETALIILDEILPALNGKKANRMVAVLNKANRFGADIGTDDSEQVYYSYDDEQETFFTSKEKPTKQEVKEKKLSLKDFGITTE